MDDIQILETRVNALEKSVGLGASYSELGEINKKLKDVATRMEAVEITAAATAKRIPDTSQFVTSSNLRKSAEAIMSALVDHIVEQGEKSKKALERKLEATLIQVANDAQAAKLAAASVGRLSADALIAKSLEFAR